MDFVFNNLYSGKRIESHCFPCFRADEMRNWKKMCSPKYVWAGLYLCVLLYIRICVIIRILLNALPWKRTLVQNFAYQFFSTASNLNLDFKCFYWNTFAAIGIFSHLTKLKALCLCVKIFQFQLTKTSFEWVHRLRSTWVSYLKIFVFSFRSGNYDVDEEPTITKDADEVGLVHWPHMGLKLIFTHLTLVKEGHTNLTPGRAGIRTRGHVVGK